jgi:acetate kinase
VRCILTINGGSSSVKFALYGDEAQPRRIMRDQVQRMGSSADEEPAARELVARILEQLPQQATIAGVGHRVVHGGLGLIEHQRITDRVIAELKRTQPLDLAHLPREIALIEAMRRKSPEVPQVACFDTAFHRELPRVAQLLPIPRRYGDAGVRRFGFHGLSYAYLVEELHRVAGEVANGRVILAHLGSGASMVALRNGKPVDTSMAFTPTAGLMMGTRPGDLDPGLLVYMMRVERLSPEAMDDFLSKECGLLGVSETSFDMRDLIERCQQGDARAAEAIELFCYQAKKFIGAYTAALGGLDTLVFSAGIGEHSPPTRESICAGLEFLGVRIDAQGNASNSPVISASDSRVVVRVIPTDEEQMIARCTWRVLNSLS